LLNNAYIKYVGAKLNRDIKPGLPSPNGEENKR
jgi:hypothetical protein